MATSALDLLVSGSEQSAGVLAQDTDQDNAQNDAEPHVRNYAALLKRKQTALSRQEGRAGC